MISDVAERLGAVHVHGSPHTCSEALAVDRPFGYVIFYDARCELCRRSRAWLQRRGAGEPMTFIDVNDRRAMAQWPEIDFDQAQDEVFVRDPRGRFRKSWEAVVILTAATVPLVGRLQPILCSAPMVVIGDRLYHLVSDRRYQISAWVWGEEVPPEKRGAEAWPGMGGLAGVFVGAAAGLAMAWAADRWLAPDQTG